MLLIGTKTELADLEFSSHGRYRVSQVSLENGARIQLLDDARGLKSKTRGLYCSANNKSVIIKSLDNGKTWQKVYSAPANAKISRLFVGKTCLIVQLVEPLQTVIINDDGFVSQTLEGPGFPWHGSQGIDEGPAGTIIFGEYQSQNPGVDLSLWRLSKDGDFQPVLTKTTGRRPPDGEIRHFHTCFSDKFAYGVWYASSGDFLTHNRLWVSLDEGSTWKEPELYCHDATNFGIKRTERLLRFTSVVQLGRGHFIWATDDGLGIKTSAVVEAHVTSYKINMNILGTVSKNYFRNAIRFEEQVFFVSESKNDVAVVDFASLDLKSRTLEMVSTSNVSGKVSPVTASIASQQAVDGKAFVPGLGVVFSADKAGILCLERVEYAN